MEPLRIEMLADYCHISETHLRRLFSFYINMGPLEYINLIRIQNFAEAFSPFSFHCLQKDIQNVKLLLHQQIDIPIDLLFGTIFTILRRDL